MNNYDGPADMLARKMTEINQYPSNAQWKEETPGSFGTFAGDDKKIPTITLELPRKIEEQSIFDKNISAIEAVVVF